jgi:hypothetical protein
MAENQSLRSNATTRFLVHLLSSNGTTAAYGKRVGFETEASARAHAMNYDSLRLSTVSYNKSLNNIFVVFVHVHK